MSESAPRPDPAQAQVLQRFAAAVRARYGTRRDRMLLCGARARGDARAESDYDVAVVPREADSMPAECLRLFQIASDLRDGTAAGINPLLSQPDVPPSA